MSLRAKLNPNSHGYVVGGSPFSGPGSPLMAMEKIFLAAARGLAHLRVWLAADGHGGDVFLAAAGGLAQLRAWLAADSIETNSSSPPLGGPPTS